jgi:hypothetical protein
MEYDADRNPSDWVYLTVNKAFERLTGLEKIAGKHVTDAIPGIRESYPELFVTYGRVASTGIPETFIIDFKPIGRLLNISVFSPRKDHFIAVFQVIDRQGHDDPA